MSNVGNVPGLPRGDIDAGFQRADLQVFPVIFALSFIDPEDKG